MYFDKNTEIHTHKKNLFLQFCFFWRKIDFFIFYRKYIDFLTFQTSCRFPMVIKSTSWKGSVKIKNKTYCRINSKALKVLMFRKQMLSRNIMIIRYQTTIPTYIPPRFRLEAKVWAAVSVEESTTRDGQAHHCCTGRGCAQWAARARFARQSAADSLSCRDKEQVEGKSWVQQRQKCGLGLQEDDWGVHTLFNDRYNHTRS